MRAHGRTKTPRPADNDRSQPDTQTKKVETRAALDHVRYASTLSDALLLAAIRSYPALYRRRSPIPAGTPPLTDEQQEAHQ